MAIRNDERIYSGGGVVFDSSPSVNLYGQLLAKKQAKMEALDEYDRQRINNINPNGVRDVDREGLDKRIKDIQDYYQQNKGNIRRTGTPESYNYEKMFRDVSSYINQSKERTAKQDAAMKLYQERLKQDGRIPDDFIKELNENDMAIDADVVDATGTQRKAKSLELTKWLSQPKPFSQQAYLKLFSDIKRTAGQPKYSPVEGNPLKLTETIEETFDDGSKQVIAARSADKYQNSFSFAEQVKTEVADPVARKNLEDVFLKEFGTKPSQMEDYATALTMTLLQPRTEKVKTVDNKEAIMAQQQAYAKERLAISAQNSLKRLYAAFGLQQQSDENISSAIDNLIVSHITSGKNNNGIVLTDAETYKAITGKDKSASSVLTVDDEGNYSYGIKDANGQIQVQGTVPYQLGKAKLVDQYKGGYKKKINPNTTTKPTATGSNPVRVPKTYKVGGKSLTQEQIEKGAKKYNMTVEQYLKSIGAN